MPSARPLSLIATLSFAMLACEAPPPTPPSEVAELPADSLRVDSLQTDSLQVDSLDAPAAVLDTVDVRGVNVARARLASIGEGLATGVVTLSRVSGGVRVVAEVQGLTPDAFHALQILRGRDCDADPAAHLRAPADTTHGSPSSLPGLRHAGDLGNVRSESDGAGRYDRIDAVLSLDGTVSPVGRAVVVRAGRDDASSPDGAAGEVIGCGVIERAR